MYLPEHASPQLNLNPLFSISVVPSFPFQIDHFTMKSPLHANMLLMNLRRVDTRYAPWLAKGQR